MSEADQIGRLTDVDGIGPATAETLLEEFDSLAELCEVCHDLPDGYSPARLSRLDGFGPGRARTVAQKIDESGLPEEVLEDGDA